MAKRTSENAGGCGSGNSGHDRAFSRLSPRSLAGGGRRRRQAEKTPESSGFLGRQHDFHAILLLITEDPVAMRRFGEGKPEGNDIIEPDSTFLDPLDQLVDIYP